MLKLFLLGGENVFKRSAKEVNQQAFQDAEEPVNVLVFPWARASFDRRYQKRKILFDYFRSLGADTVNFVEYADATENIAQKITAARLVYLTGGQPSVLIERLQNSGVDRLLKEYRGVIVGRSAGALALCQRCIATPRSTSKPKIVQGVGLVNLTLKVHYKPEDEDTLKRFSKHGAIYAVPEGSALVCDGNQLSTINSVYLFEGGEKQTLG